jgi:hypothetical protein
MEIDEGDETCAMSICSDNSSSSSDFLAPLMQDLHNCTSGSGASESLDSISFRLALKRARAEHGLFGTC